MAWQYVQVTLLGISFIASLAIWIWSLRTIRRSSDPVRKPFREASGATFILTVGIFISFLTMILGLAGADLGERGYAHLENIASLWSNLADATMFVALAYLTMSIMRLRDPHTDMGKALRMRKFAALGYFAVLLTMSVVYFGFNIHVLNRQRDLGNTADDWMSLLNAIVTSGRLALSLAVLILLGNLGLLVEAVKVMLQTHTSRSVTTASHYFMAIVNVWLIRSLFLVITVAQYTVLDSSTGYSRAYMTIWYKTILLPILEDWPFIAALGVFIGLGARSYNGVWSHNVDGMMQGNHPDAPKDDRRHHHVPV